MPAELIYVHDSVIVYDILYDKVVVVTRNILVALVALQGYKVEKITYE